MSKFEAFTVILLIIFAVAYMLNGIFPHLLPASLMDYIPFLK